MAAPLIRPRTLALAATVSAFFAALSQSGAAQPSSGLATVVAVRAPPCIDKPFDRARLIELLGIELAALGVTEVVIPAGEPNPSSGRPSRLLATIVVSPTECAVDATELTIALVDYASSKTVERRMTVGDIDVVERPRAIAIAISELLQASLAELELASAPRSPVLVPPAVHAALLDGLRPVTDAARRETDERILAATREQEERARAAEAASERRANEPELELSGFGWALPSRGTALLGGSGALRVRGRGVLAYHLGAAVGAGSVDVSEGSASIWSATGSAGVGIATKGSVELDVFSSLHVGYAAAHGTPDRTTPLIQGHSYGNAIAMLMLNTTLRAPVDGASSVLFGVDLGYVLADVSFLADTSRVAGIGGVLLGLRAGVSFGL